MIRILSSHLLLFLLFSLCFLCQAAEATDTQDVTQEQCWPSIRSINIEILNIFDADQNAWYQRFANSAKINTRKETVLRLLPFAVGDSLCQPEIDEAERILRKIRFLRNPRIHVDAEGNIQVTTRDAWTLFPTFSVSRSGGKDRSSIGIRDSNLLGLGLSSTFKFKEDEQQTGYRLSLSTPFHWIDKASIDLVLEDYEEGSSTQFFFDKPFYTMHDETMYRFGLNDEALQYTLFHNLDDQLIYVNQSTVLAAEYGWLNSINAQSVERISIGARSFSKSVEDFSSEIYPEITTDIKQNLLYARLAYQEFEFEKLRNLRLIYNVEDINFGTSFSFTLGIGKYAIDDDKGEYLHLKSQLSDGWRIGQFLLFNQLQITAELFSESPAFSIFANNFEVFYELPDAGTFYWANEISYLSHYYYGIQAVGDETGLRGFPLQYQHGKNRWVSRLEFRQYTNWNLFDSIAVGVAYFFDAGKAWDNDVLSNIEPNTLYSAGLGLRFFPHVISGQNVFHVDLVRAFSKALDGNGYEFRVSVRNSF